MNEEDTAKYAGDTWDLPPKVKQLSRDSTFAFYRDTKLPKPPMDKTQMADYAEWLKTHPAP